MAVGVELRVEGALFRALGGWGFWVLGECEGYMEELQGHGQVELIGLSGEWLR